MSSLDIQSLQYTHENGQKVFTDISLDIAQGEFTAILGPSGCGKSTLLRTIAGLATPQAGQIFLGEKLLVSQGHEKIPAEKRHIGMVFQDYALFPLQTVYENIAFGLQKYTAAEKQQRVTELLNLIGMETFAHHKPHQLSGGQQQRVALARALAPRPRLLLLDEPFANIDTTLRQTLGTALQMITAHEQVSVLLVTHDWSEAFSLADRIAILLPTSNGSRIIQYDTPQQIYHRPATQQVAALSGSSTLIAGTAMVHHAETVLGTLPLIEAAEGAGHAVLRPEMVLFKENPTGNSTILARVFQGNSYRLVCETPAGNVFAKMVTRTPPAIGTRGDVIVNEACWWV